MLKFNTKQTFSWENGSKRDAVIIRRKHREKLAKYIIVSGSIFWIFAGAWGINNCLNAAKENREHYIQSLTLNNNSLRVPAVELATWVPPPVNSESVYQQLENSGLAETPYMFDVKLVRPMLIFGLCVLVSFFVLYAVLVVNPKKKFLLSEAKTDTSFDLSRFE
jgi:hypothetical protein